MIQTLEYYKYKFKHLPTRKLPKLEITLKPYLNIKRYTQDWKAYNFAQTNEFKLFQDILIELIDSLIQTKSIRKRGRPFNNLKEMLFCCVMRAYYGKSSRRSVSFLEIGKTNGYISSIPHFNSVLNYYKDSSLTSLLKHLIEQSAIPLKKIECDFATDSSGFSTSLFGRWLDVRTGSNNHRRLFKKAHIFSGVKTNIITSVEITPGYQADSPVFKKLIEITSKNFEMKEISADMAYSSRDNLQLATDYGAIPYIPFKKNTIKKPRGHLVWSRMWKYFDENREEFMQHYHKRSNVETIFSTIKRKFGQKLFSKSEIGQTNEILCKILAYNICVLIQELFELDITLDYNYCAKVKIRR
jgi:transposase